MRDYIEQATRTESIDKFKVDSPRILHATIGASTEIAECLLAIDDINVVEEVGDVLWYLAIFADATGTTFEDLKLLGQMELSAQDEIEIDAIQTLLQMSSEALDVVKRALFYGVPLDEVKIARKFGVLLLALEYHLIDDGFTLDMAMAANIAKLTRRYGEKFTTDAAVNRDIEGEIEQLKMRLQ